MAGLEFARGGFQFNANMGGREVAIDPRLVEILNATAEEFPFRAVAFSGVAARGSTQNHPGGQAGGGYNFVNPDAAGFGYPAYGTTGLIPGSGF